MNLILIFHMTVEPRNITYKIFKRYLKIRNSLSNKNFKFLNSRLLLTEFAKTTSFSDKNFSSTSLLISYISD